LTSGKSWFAETLYPDYQQRHLIERVLYEEKTEYQELVIFESPRFGRVLALDGVVQTTERDEFVYHEMLTHVPILAHGDVKRVCIIGGGDGGAMEEALKHPGVETVTLVEIDPKVVELTKAFIPSIPGKAFDDPRAELVIADGREFVKKPPARYDVIIVDSTDPIGPAQVLFEQDFYADCRDALTARGIMITQSGVTFMQADEARGTYKRLSALFPDATFYVAQVPTYAAGFMTLGWGCRDASVRATPRETIEARFKAAKLDTRYYNPAIHQACFALPTYIERLKG
jgi:spermidine synthase